MVKITPKITKVNPITKLGTFFPALLAAALTNQAHACATCGVADSFTLGSIMISFTFSMIPFALVGFIGWRIYKANKEPT